MSDWTPTTDDDFTMGDVADAVHGAMQEWGAGESAISGFAKDDEDRKVFSVVVAAGPADVVAIHIDWSKQEVVTAWKNDD